MTESPGSRGAEPVLVLRHEHGRLVPDRDSLVTEEPLEIQLRWEPLEAPIRLLVTMRTPGDDVDLVTGLLFSENVVSLASEILSVDRPADPRTAEDLARNVAVVTLASQPRSLPERATFVSSACGVCGKTSIEEVLRRSPDLPTGPFSLDAEVLTALPDLLRRRQDLFEKTGGLHAAGLFSADGRVRHVREDVGRHNAVDKVIGAAHREGLPVPPVLVVSGRLGFEIVQKAVLAGVRLVAGVSAPTTLAVQLAEESGLTLVGFLRGSRFNVYAHPEALRLSPST